jgi:hypothetical protein
VPHDPLDRRLRNHDERHLLGNVDVGAVERVENRRAARACSGIFRAEHEAVGDERGRVAEKLGETHLPLRLIPRRLVEDAVLGDRPTRRQAAAERSHTLGLSAKLSLGL